MVRGTVGRQSKIKRKGEINMKIVKYIGKEKMDYLVKDNDMDLMTGKEYEVIKETERNYIVIDESGEDYAYPKSFFEIVEE